MSQRTVSCLAAAAALALTGLAAGSATAGTSASTPVFGVPRIVDPIHAYGEPDLAVNPKSGALHASGPQGTGSQRSIWNVSRDGGDSYRIVQSVPPNAYQSQVQPTKSLVGPGGGDTDIAIAHNGKTFFNDLYSLTCFAAGTTSDDGATQPSYAAPGDAGCSQVGADRQWFALFDPQPADHTVSPYTGTKPLAYMEYQQQGTTQDQVSMSTDGVNYLTSAGVYADDGKHSPNHTPPIVDQHTGDLLGLTSNGSSNSLALALGKPDAAGKLTFTYTPVADHLAGNPQTLFPTLAEDTARNLYAVWIDSTKYQVWYSWAPAAGNWSAWTTPRQVNTAPANTNVLPWAVAGGPGILDIAWYGTNKTLAQLTSSDPLKSDGPSASDGQTWNLFFDQLTAANSGKPVGHEVVAAQHPMHYNDICMDGTLCAASGGNRNQADFFKVVLAADGRARIIFTDESNGLSELNNTDSAADHAGAALDTVVTQEGGLNAYTGKPLTPRETRAPRASVTDPSGDALFRPLGGTNVAAADIKLLAVKRTASDLVFTIGTAGGRLGDAAVAGRTATAELVVRWQQGNRLYHAGIWQTAAGGPLNGYAGTTSSVDLCSVSLCKPNYLEYGAVPLPGTSAATATSASGAQGTTYTLTVPLTAVGSPSASTLLEEVMGFVTVSAVPPAVQLDTASAFADEVPLQIEGTKTFNFRAASVTGGGTTTSKSSGSGSKSGSGGSKSGGLADTGLPIGLPILAILLTATALGLRRFARGPAAAFSRAGRRQL
ncbi:MAG: hypothetical protein QOG34_709 [Frankiaceae bacterium]|nr:hypothetical protein [Frankiaceae bacterium]